MDKQQIWDVIIVGGGPAGLTAGLYLARDLYQVLIVESDVLGGMVAQTDRVDNYPAVEAGTAGMTIAKAMADQTKQAGAKVTYSRIESIQALNDKSSNQQARFSLKTEDGSDLLAKTVILATGTRYRHLGVPGEEELLGKSLHFCGLCDGPLYRGRDVIVVGGGNSAVETALFLTKFASKVWLLAREELTATPALQQELEGDVAKAKIKILKPTEIQELVSGDGKLKFVRVKVNGQLRELAADGIFVAIGTQPQIELAKSAGIKCDKYGINAERNQTTIPGLFVAGDVVSGNDRQITVAVGDGTQAALRASEYLRNFSR